VKKLELVLEACPHILLDGKLKVEKVEEVAAIKGMGINSAEAFVSHISLFTSFLKEIGHLKKLFEFEKGKKEVSVDQGHPLFGKTVVLTGTRDKTVIDLLQRSGAKQGATVGKSTFMLVVKNGKLEMTVKMEEAKSLGIPILGVEEFVSKYGI
jgi:NAD-dependent DNA ligase